MRDTKWIGLLGGSFDPIHKGHIYMAAEAYASMDLDEVWLIPNGNAPHKDATQMTDASDRFAMCQLAIEDYTYDFLRVCDIEVTSEEYSYTYRTMQKLVEQYPYPEYLFYFIMGADSLDYFDKWRHPEIIASLCRIVVVNRGEFTEKEIYDKITQIKGKFPAEISLLHCEKYNISSTEIRNGSSLDGVTSSVKQYILKNNLYGRGE